MMINRKAPRFTFCACLLVALYPILSGKAQTPTAERIRELRQTIAHHDCLYFEEARPEISDLAYDRLVAELARLEEGCPEVIPPLNSEAEPGRTGQEAVSSRTRHLVPMLSLKKVHGPAGVRAFYEQLIEESGLPAPEICLEPKIDGMAVSLVYIKGCFDRALTRGDGRKGVDITRNIRAIPEFPEVLVTAPGETLPHYLELRGELYISTPDFERLNADRMASGLAPFSTERNLAAGTALSDDADAVRQRGLRLACFDWGAWEPEKTAPISQADFLEIARGWGLPLVKSMGIASGLRELLQLVAAGRKAAKDSELPLDGLVLKVSDVELRKQLGTGPDAPNWALAYKFPPKEVVTELLAVHYQIGRTGRLSPVAELNPVMIDGREISRASLHNWSFIREHDLRLGDQLVIRLSGDVIPRISGLKAAASDPESPLVEFPGSCPECGQAVTFTREMATGECRAVNCVGRLREEILYFGKVMGIRGLGPESVRQLVESGVVTMPADLYRLRSKAQVVAKMVGEADGKRLVEAIEVTRGAPFQHVLEALGIPGIGSAGAARIADRFPTWEALLDWSPEDVLPGSTSEDARMASLLGDYLQDPDKSRKLRLLERELNSSTREGAGPVPIPAAGLPAGPG